MHGIILEVRGTICRCAGSLFWRFLQPLQGLSGDLINEANDIIFQRSYIGTCSEELNLCILSTMAEIVEQCYLF